MRMGACGMKCFFILMLLLRSRFRPFASTKCRCRTGNESPTGPPSAGPARTVGDKTHEGASPPQNPLPSRCRNSVKIPRTGAN